MCCATCTVHVGSLRLRPLCYTTVLHNASWVQEQNLWWTCSQMNPQYNLCYYTYTYVTLWAHYKHQCDHDTVHTHTHGYLVEVLLHVLDLSLHKVIHEAHVLLLHTKPAVEGHNNQSSTQYNKELLHLLGSNKLNTVYVERMSANKRKKLTGFNFHKSH